MTDKDRFLRNAEILRRRCVDGLGVTEVAALFGVSRQTVYNVSRAYEHAGLAGIVPAKVGPRGGYKCTAEVLAYISRCRRSEPDVSVLVLVGRIHSVFGVKVHPNTIRYAIHKAARAGQRQSADDLAGCRPT